MGGNGKRSGRPFEVDSIGTPSDSIRGIVKVNNESKMKGIPKLKMTRGTLRTRGSFFFESPADKIADISLRKPATG
jgi:hypothetical protein